MALKIDTVTGTFPDVPVLKKEESVIWRGLKITINFFYETPAMVVGMVVGGIAAQIFIPPLAITCYALALASLFSKVFLKLLSHFDIKWLDQLEVWAVNLKKKFPYIQTAMIIGSLVVGYIFPIIGGVSALIVGGYNGIIFEQEYCKYLQRRHKCRIEEAEVEDRSELLHLLV